MRAKRTNKYWKYFIRGFAGIGFLAAILMSHRVHTGAIQFFLSKNAVKWGVHVQVNQASVGFFPPEIELTGLEVSGETERFFSASSVLIAPQRFWRIQNKWIINRLEIHQVSGQIPDQWLFNATSPATDSGVPFECEISEIKIDQVQVHTGEKWGHLEFKMPVAAIDSVTLGPTQFSAVLQEAELTVHPQKNSLLWNAPMVFDKLQAQMGGNYEDANLQIQTESNWGEIQGELHRTDSKSELEFIWNWTPETWPLDTSLAWVQLFKSRVLAEQLSGQLSRDKNTEITGQVQVGNWNIPASGTTQDWTIGPIQLEPLAPEWDVVWNQIQCPRYIHESRLWQLEIMGGNNGIAFNSSPLEESNPIKKHIEFQWNPGEGQHDLRLILAGLTFSENVETSSGQPWRFEGDLSLLPEEAIATFSLADRNGSIMRGNTDAAWDSVRWSHTTECSVETQHSLSSDVEWDLFAKLNIRGNQTWDGDGIQIVEFRDITLLENRIPRSFERLDLVLKQNLSEWAVTWESDLINGFARGNSQAIQYWRLHPWTWTESSSSPSLTESISGTNVHPQLEFATTIKRFRPIGLLTNLPFALGDKSSIEGQWDSQSFALQADLSSFNYKGLTTQNLQVTWDEDENNQASLSCAIQEAVLNEKTIASSIEVRALQSEDWRGEIDWDQGSTKAPGAMTFQFSNNDNGFVFAMDSLYVPFGEDGFRLNKPLLAAWSRSERQFQVQPFRLESSQGHLDTEVSYQMSKGIDLSTAMKWHTSQGLSFVPKAWTADGFDGEIQITGLLPNPEIKGAFQLHELTRNEFQASNITAQVNGPIRSPRAEISASIAPAGILNGEVQISMEDPSNTFGFVKFEQIDLTPVNQFLPDQSFELEGTAAGLLRFSGLDDQPQLDGYITTETTALRIPYLNTRYTIDGNAVIHPGEFLLNQWKITDEMGQNARFNGTVLHKNFQNWDLDFGVDAQAAPIQLMNTPPSDDGFFFGKASCTGDINIAGFGQKLTIDAQLRTEKGTLFSLPMDVNSDVSSAQFLRFNTPEKGSEPRIERRGDFSDIQLNLGIDVSPQAEARIIFDRSVGDEIVGKAEGHLDLIVDDLENLQLTGNLEIKEGTYYFTLQNWLSKRFQVTPGGTIVWEGDPYQAEINLATSYATRARLDPLLPTAVDLPGRIPVELGLQLTGALMRPSLDFDIRTPNADSRIQALMANALLNEEEVQRQGLSLLVMNQFFGTDLSQSAIGGFLNPAQSAQLLANQLGHWISQISPGMDLGLDYAQDEFSGEQALGIALSTQLFNDRLHIEGAIGAQSMGQIQPDDVQIQDLTISYDLSDDGTWQLTGHTRQNPGLSNAIEGNQTQGVGLRFRREFDRWGDWKNE